MKITITEYDDWIALYKDGGRVWNTHSCGIIEGLEALGIEFDYINQCNVDPRDVQFTELLCEMSRG